MHCVTEWPCQKFIKSSIDSTSIKIHLNRALDFLLLLDGFEVGQSPFIFKLDEHCSVIRLEPLTLWTRMSAHLETNINITTDIFADFLKEIFGIFHEIWRYIWLFKSVDTRISSASTCWSRTLSANVQKCTKLESQWPSLGWTRRSAVLLREIEVPEYLYHSLSQRWKTFGFAEKFLPSFSVWLNKIKVVYPEKIPKKLLFSRLSTLHNIFRHSGPAHCLLGQYPSLVYCFWCMTFPQFLS